MGSSSGCPLFVIQKHVFPNKFYFSFIIFLWSYIYKARFILIFQLYASVRLKMEEMQQHSMSWIEVQFLKMAVDVLCSCRQTLMYTYVFAFYLRKNNQSIIFEVSQIVQIYR